MGWEHRSKGGFATKTLVVFAGSRSGRVLGSPLSQYCGAGDYSFPGDKPWTFGWGSVKAAKSFARSTSPAWELIITKTRTLQATPRNANILLRWRWSATSIPSLNAAISDSTVNTASTAIPKAYPNSSAPGG